MKVPILLYHALFDKELNREKYAINKNEFERHIKYLSENGFSSILFDDFYKLHKFVDNNKKSVIITFDDGNYSDYSIAFPILKKYGFNAVFFVTTKWIGAKNYMTWPNLKEMAASGMSIQSHGATHSFLSDLKSDDLDEELRGSRDILCRKLDTVVNSISLPGGFCSKKVLNMARNSGYTSVYTSKPGLNLFGASAQSFTVLNRFVITQKTSFEDFKSIVNGNKKKIAMYKAEYYLKNGAKKILGSKKYYNIWSKFFKYRT